MPPNSCVLHKLLDLGEKVFAFDYNLACSGFVYGLSIVKGMIESQQLKSVLLVTADTYSKYIHKFSKDHIFFMAEDNDLCSYMKPNQKKILLFLSLV